MRFDRSEMKVGVVGASGYSGGELVRLLLRHPQVEIGCVTSRQYAGQSLTSVFPRFALYPGADEIVFSQPEIDHLANAAELVFLALPHGVASEFAVPLLEKGTRVVDLSADFRLDDPVVYKEFYGKDHPAPDLLDQAVYGMPEIYREQIRNARLVASPGCYPTSIILPCLPLLREGLIQPSSIIADSLSGPSGAGRKVSLPFLFVECNESLRPYGVPKHRHLSEIEQELSKVAGQSLRVQFTPHLVPINRGILTTLYLAPKAAFASDTAMAELETKVSAAFEASYADEPFVRLLGNAAFPDTKNVANTNVLEIAWRLDARTGRLIVMSAEDNLGKGASSQALQNFNIMAEYPETTGLLWG